ncbi:MAG TPA: hypothetical protein VLL96_04785, partial [Candidatus Deferrimicrobiaceae bacterium]|nr:hypothetical protein [Candidatus Deferrimicrobiaceae bacterium]
MGNRYFALVEPLTAFLLMPFYTLGGFFFGDDYVVRSLLVGMFLYTILNALLVRKISLQLNQSTKAANFAALLFAIATMAFSYAKLLYPQPIVTMLMLATIYFLFSYKKTHDSKRLFGAFLFYGLTVISFNAFIITAPFFLFYFFKSCQPIDRKMLLKGWLAIIPSILIFTLWNFAVTGNPLMTPRQVDYHMINFEVFYATESGTWLNIEGLVGTLISPIGIFFVSPVLLFFIFTPSSLIKEKKMDFLLIALLAIEFWIFFSFANLGGVAG